MTNSVDSDQTAHYDYFLSRPALFAIAFLSLLVLYGIRNSFFSFQPTNPPSLVCNGANQTHFKGWPKIALQFHASLFVKSTEPTNIFKLGERDRSICANYNRWIFTQNRT